MLLSPSHVRRMTSLGEKFLEAGNSKSSDQGPWLSRLVPYRHFYWNRGKASVWPSAVLIIRQMWFQKISWSSRTLGQKAVVSRFPRCRLSVIPSLQPFLLKDRSKHVMCQLQTSRVCVGIRCACTITNMHIFLSKYCSCTSKAIFSLQCFYTGRLWTFKNYTIHFYIKWNFGSKLHRILHISYFYFSVLQLENYANMYLLFMNLNSFGLVKNNKTCIPVVLVHLLVPCLLVL